MTLAVTKSSSNLESRGLLLAALLLVVVNPFTLLPGWFDVAGVLILGIYTILVGLYDQDTQEHYPIFAPDGALLGDSVPVATVEVVTQ